ncbi:hypothetical protein Tco_0825913 [Tanacetum coccineum]
MKKIDRGITMINHTQAEAMGKLSNVLCQVGTSETHDNEAGSSRSKRSRHETVEDVLLPQVHHEFLLWENCNQDAKSRYNTRLGQLLPRYIYSPCVMNWDILNRMGFANQEDIKFGLGGRAHSLNLLEFAQRLGLYQATELDEDRFNVYFEGGLRSDEHFNVQEYWLSISREENLSLSRSHALTIRYPILRVLHKMITYGLFQRTIGYDKIQKNDLWLLSMFDSRHQNGYANAAWLISRWMKRKGAATQKESQICYLDTTTLRELINSKSRLIPKDPQLSVLRVSIPRPPRPSMQDLYKYQMEFRAQWAGVYSVPLQGAYNPLGYAQP